LAHFGFGGVFYLLNPSQQTQPRISKFEAKKSRIICGFFIRL